MKYFSVLLIFILNAVLTAQPSKLDSLKSIHVETLHDTDKIVIYYKINHQYYQTNADSALKYGKKGLDLSVKLDLPAKMVEGYYLTASANYALGNMIASDSLSKLGLKAAIRSKDKSDIMKSYYNVALNANRLHKTEALVYYLKSFEIAEEIKEVRWQAYILRDLGQYYRAFGEYDKELEYYFKSQELFNKLGDSVYLIHNYCDISEVHRLQNNYKKALEYCEKALDISGVINNQYMEARIHIETALIYYDMGRIKDALKQNLDALEIYKNVSSVVHQGHTSTDIGKDYLKLKEYDNARKYFKKSYDIFKNMELEDAIVTALLGLGRVDLAEGKLRDAEINYQKAEKISKKNGLLPNLKETYEELAALYNSENDYKKSNKYFILLSSVKDSIYTRQKSRQINLFETEYQVKEKDARIRLQESELGLQQADLSRQRTLNYAVGVVAILLLIITALSYVSIKRKKHLNDQLRELDETKNRFFNNISHEMRTPLTLIMAPLQNLVKRTKEGPYNAELKLAYTNSKKLLERINEILDLSKLESGKMELNNSHIALYNLTKRILFSYYSIAEYRKIGLQFDYKPEKSFVVSIDVKKFEKIMNNLLLNAVKYSVVEGLVSLKVERKNNLFYFSVKDTGKGIHPDDLPNIFNRFYQTEQKEKPAEGGTGIGLTLVNEYAKLFGGKILVESKLGEGSTFTLVIPVTIIEKSTLKLDEKTFEETVEDNPTVPFLPLPIEGEKPNLLIVEDDLEMSRYLSDILSEGYSCSVAPDGMEALKKMKKSKFDIIMSDVMMPNMNGFEFREKVRSNENWVKIPFIMLTARSLDKDKIRGLQLGIDDYITKPFNPDELIARLNNLTSNKFARDNYLKENKVFEEEENNFTVEEEMLHKAEKFVIKNIDETEFTIDKLASFLNCSNRQLERLLKKYSGFTPNGFIREIRLQKAFQILEQRKFSTIKEVCYEVGLNNPAYFSVKFKERFGKNPLEVYENSRYLQ